MFKGLFNKASTELSNARGAVGSTLSTGLSNARGAVGSTLSTGLSNARDAVGSTLKTVGNSLNTAEIGMDTALNVAKNEILTKRADNPNSIFSKPIISHAVKTGTILAAIPASLGTAAVGLAGRRIASLGDSVGPKSPSSRMSAYTTKHEEFNKNLREKAEINNKIRDKKAEIEPLKSEIDRISRGYKHTDSLCDRYENVFDCIPLLEEKISDNKREINSLEKRKMKLTNNTGGSKKTRRRRHSKKMATRKGGRRNTKSKKTRKH
jgi:hypothetical protein